MKYVFRFPIALLIVIAGYPLMVGVLTLFAPGGILVVLLAAWTLTGYWICPLMQVEQPEGFEDAPKVVGLILILPFVAGYNFLVNGEWPYF